MAAAAAPSNTSTVALGSRILNVKDLSLDTFTALKAKIEKYFKLFGKSGNSFPFRMGPQTCCDYVNRDYRLNITAANRSARKELANGLLYAQWDENTGWGLVPEDHSVKAKDPLLISPEDLPAAKLIFHARLQ
jgi:hypothetical protein